SHPRRLVPRLIEATWTGEGAGGAFTEQSGRALPPSEFRPQPDARGPKALAPWGGSNGRAS
ncbi:MAG: hypothetical protein ACRD1M_13720, partial [Terriglobales bacterium]